MNERLAQSEDSRRKCLEKVCSRIQCLDLLRDFHFEIARLWQFHLERHASPKFGFMPFGPFNPCLQQTHIYMRNPALKSLYRRLAPAPPAMTQSLRVNQFHVTHTHICSGTHSHREKQTSRRVMSHLFTALQS